MLTLTQINYIKHLRDEEGKTITDIADKLEISWRTAKKYADGEVNAKDRPKQRRKRRVMGPYTEIVDSWLEEDRLLPKKATTYGQGDLQSTKGTYRLLRIGPDHKTLRK